MKILGVHFRGLGYILFGSTFRVLWDLEKISHDILVVGVCIEMNQEYRISLGRISPSDCTTFGEYINHTFTWCNYLHVCI